MSAALLFLFTLFCILFRIDCSKGYDEDNTILGKKKYMQPNLNLHVEDTKCGGLTTKPHSHVKTDSAQRLSSKCKN